MTHHTFTPAWPITFPSCPLSHSPGETVTEHCSITLSRTQCQAAGRRWNGRMGGKIKWYVYKSWNCLQRRVTTITCQILKLCKSTPSWMWHTHTHAHTHTHTSTTHTHTHTHMHTHTHTSTTHSHWSRQLVMCGWTTSMKTHRSGTKRDGSSFTGGRREGRNSILFINGRLWEWSSSCSLLEA